MTLVSPAKEARQLNQEQCYLPSTTKVPRPGKVWMSPSERRMSRA